MNDKKLFNMNIFFSTTEMIARVIKTKDDMN